MLVLFLNRSYFPDAEATGQLLTELCEDLHTQGFSVQVIAGQPNSNPSASPFRRYGTEQVNGVRVHRVWHTRFPKTGLFGRACNLITFTISATLAGLFKRRPDVVVTETDPPFLCLVGRLLAVRFRCRHICYLQDIHPQLGLALGKLRRRPWTRLLRGWFHRAYRRADQVIVLSRDMSRYLERTGVSPAKIQIIPNWVDTQRIVPVKQGNRLRQEWQIGDQFLVMYSGNLGVCQDLSTILDAAELLQSQADAPRNKIQFMFVGSGVSKQPLMDEVSRRGLTNVRFADYQPLSRLSESLSAADLHLVPIDSRAIRYLMPSKLYGILASGTPLIAIAPRTSELAELVEDNQVGASVPPHDSQALADQIIWFSQWCPDRAAYSQRARDLAETRFDRTHSVQQFANVLQGKAATAPTPKKQLLHALTPDT